MRVSEYAAMFKAESAHWWYKNLRDEVVTARGVLILQVPAFKALHSQHDVNVHGAHRFAAKEIRGGLQRAGFSRFIVYYRHNLVLGAAWIGRKVFFRNAQRSQVSVPSPFLNASLYKYSRAESSLNRRVSIPFGLSVFAVAYRCFLNMLFDGILF